MNVSHFAAYTLRLCAIAFLCVGCSRSEPKAGSGGTGALAPLAKGVVDGAWTYPIKLSNDRRMLVDQKDKPFMLYGDAAWSLIVQLKREQAETYLEDRRRRGFNVVMVNLLENNFSDHPPDNAYGDGPFTTAGDYSTPNDAYFAHADWVIRKAAEKGLVVLLTPSYLGYGGGKEGWYQKMEQNGVAKLREYGRYVGKRYQGFDNLIWLEGGDYTPPRVELVNAIAEGIKEHDARHLHTVHWSPETSGSEVPVSGWLDFDTTYTYKLVYLKGLDDYARKADMPRILLESAYEGEHDSTPQSLRAQAYYALLTGAQGQIFGNYAIWRFKDEWPSQLGSAGSVSMTRVRELFESIDWTQLVPDRGSEVLVGGAGTRGTPDHAVLARRRDGRLAVLYVPRVREVTLNLAQLAGRAVRARWYDPWAGAYRDADGSPLPAKQIALRPPGHNARGDDDWILLLESVN